MILNDLPSSNKYKRCPKGSQEGTTYLLILIAYLLYY
jgi:hypothetical protein